MADSSIDVRAVFSDTSTRDRFQFILQKMASSADTSAELEQLGLPPSSIAASASSLIISQIKTMGEMALEFQVQGSVNAASVFVASLVETLKRLNAAEIIYADLNEQVMEIAVYYHSDKAECSYETGFDGDADEVLWEADSDGTLLDTVRELALNNQLNMPVF